MNVHLPKYRMTLQDRNSSALIRRFGEQSAVVLIKRIESAKSETYKATIRLVEDRRLSSIQYKQFAKLLANTSSYLPNYHNRKESSKKIAMATARGVESWLTEMALMVDEMKGKSGSAIKMAEGIIGNVIERLRETERGHDYTVFLAELERTKNGSSFMKLARPSNSE